MRKVLIGMFCGAVLAFPLAGITANSETYRQLDLFGDVFERIHTDYVTEVEDAPLIEAAINGMLQSLDPHSGYLNPDTFRAVQVQTRGEFGGLGIEVTMEGGVVKVVAPIDDTPAAKAGIKAGDLITHLDGEPILGLALDQAVDKMRGPVNTQLRLTVVRESEDAPLEFTITRDIITAQSVRWRTEGDIGYIRITTFNEQTESGLEQALSELTDDIGQDMVGFVLDLRNNPGGLLDQAVAVADAFLDKGEIVSTRGRDNRDIQRYQSRPGDLAKDIPIIVLINGGSASASEIVAGALQDHRRAVILGKKSFGKGSVQTIIPLRGGGEGALKLTTAKYYTPSGRSIQAKGIEPDFVVEMSRKEDEERPELPSETDLRNHLAPEDDVKQEQMTEAQPKEGMPDDILELEMPLDDEVEDYQLERALQILRGLAQNGEVATVAPTTVAN